MDAVSESAKYIQLSDLSYGTIQRILHLGFYLRSYSLQIAQKMTDHGMRRGYIDWLFEQLR